MSTYNVGNVEIALTSQMSEAVKAVNQLAAELNKISAILKGVKITTDSVGKSADTTGKKSKTALSQIASAAKSAQKSLSGMFALNKLYFFVNYTKRMAQGIAGIVQSAVDYRETVNKFAVSMGDMYDRAVAFQNKMSDAYGLATDELMNYQANFNNIIKGLGNVDVDVAYNMSETLTQMSVDFASLFNTSIDSAMTKFQSALTQQVRPIRSVSGFDITTPTLKSVMLDIGIDDRTISQLNQVEKRLLIIIALQKQMQNVGAMGDFARTIEQPANQLKILSEQLRMAGREIGQFALHWIAPAIKYVLGFVMAIRTLIQTLAGLAGYEEDDSVSAPLIGFEDSANSATGAIGKTKKAVEDLKKATTGIDELNIIQQPTDTSGGGGGAGGSLPGIDSRLLSELEKYNSVLDDVSMKAKEIRDNILDWLGVTDGTFENFNKIKAIVESLAAIITSAFATKKVYDFLNALGLIVPSAGSAIGIFVGVLTAIIGIARIIDGINDLLDETKDKVVAILKIIEGIGLVIAGIGIIIGIVAGGWVVAIIGAVVALIAFIVQLIYENWDKITAYWEYSWEKEKEIFAPLLNYWSIAWQKAKEFFTPLIEKFMEIKQKVVDFFTPIFENIKIAWEKIKEIGGKIGELIKSAKLIIDYYVVEPIKKFITSVKTWIDEHIVQPIKQVIDKIMKWYTEKIYTPIMSFFKKVYGWLDEHIFTPVKNVFEKIKNFISVTIKNIGTGIGNVFKGVINFVIGAFESLINLVIKGINKIIDFANAVPGVDISKVQEVSFKRLEYGTFEHYATGGFPTRGDYFLANENGVPEYVGSIGNRTAVANTNQIVQGISYGVSMAQSEQNQLLRQQNEYLRRILEKPNGVYMNGRDVANEIDRAVMARGAKVLSGGY